MNDYDREQLGPARGIVNGVIGGLIAWAVFAGVIWLGVHTMRQQMTYPSCCGSRVCSELKMHEVRK